MNSLCSIYTCMGKDNQYLCYMTEIVCKKCVFSCDIFHEFCVDGLLNGCFFSFLGPSWTFDGVFCPPMLKKYVGDFVFFSFLCNNFVKE